MITIANLRDAGLSADQIVAVLETAERENLARRRQNNRIAVRAYRERQKTLQKQQSHHQNHNDSDDDLPLPSPPPMVSPITPSLTPSLSLPLHIYSAKSQQNWPKDYRDQFWNAYPRKVGKLAALRKLETVRKSGSVNFEILLRAVRAIDAGDEQFIPHPTTWLNQGRYLDPVEGVKHTNGHAVDWQAREDARDKRIANQLAERQQFAERDRRKSSM